MTKLLKFSVLQITYTKKMTFEWKNTQQKQYQVQNITVKHAHIIYSPNLRAKMSL